MMKNWHCQLFPLPDLIAERNKLYPDSGHYSSGELLCSLLLSIHFDKVVLLCTHLVRHCSVSEFLHEIMVELVALKMHHSAIVVNLVVPIDVEHYCEALHS